jgi:hypothetical protein
MLLLLFIGSITDGRLCMTVSDAGLMTMTLSDGLAYGGSSSGAGSPSWLITLGIGTPGGVTPLVLTGLGTSSALGTSAFTMTVSDGLVLVMTTTDAGACA